MSFYEADALMNSHSRVLLVRKVVHIDNEKDWQKMSELYWDYQEKVMSDEDEYEIPLKNIWMVIKAHLAEVEEYLRIINRLL